MTHYKYDVSSDGRSVWVNGNQCVGRFGPFGVDFLKEPNTSFFNRNGTTRANWDFFQEKILETFKVDVGIHCADKLKFKHNCNDCIFLGTWKAKDLYFC